MGYLVAISFLLHLMTIFMIIILLQKINTVNPTTHTTEQEKLKKEIEDLLLAYSSEMKEENEKLVSKLIQKKETQKKLHTNTKKSYENPQKSNVDKKKEPVSSTVNKEKTNSDELFVPPIVADKVDIIEQSSTAQILSLANQGYSAKEIAKKLNIGDGEVELLLKFHK